MPYSGNDRFSVKQVASLLGEIALWPGSITVWHAMVATAVAPVAALPTTAAQASLWNGNPLGSGKILIPLNVGTITVVTAAAAINLGLAAHVTTGLVTTVPAGTVASTIKPLTGVDNYGGSASFKSAVTIVNDGIWHPVAPTIVCANTATLMLTTEADVGGRYVIMPGQQFSLASLCNAAGTATCDPWIIWAEATLRTS